MSNMSKLIMKMKYNKGIVFSVGASHRYQQVLIIFIFVTFDVHICNSVKRKIRAHNDTYEGNI